jgi:hypothetical protein
MRKREAEAIDEFAATQVLVDPMDQPAGQSTDALALYAEYERELAHDPTPQPARKPR